MEPNELRIKLSDEMAVFVRELAGHIGITPEELATAAVTHIVDLPVPVATGVCVAHLGDTFDDNIDETA